MKKLMNNRGLFAVQVAWMAFVLCNVVISYAVRHDFRERKAVEKLVAQGVTEENAKAEVKTWTREQVLASIQDKDPNMCEDYPNCNGAQMRMKEIRD